MTSEFDASVIICTAGTRDFIKDCLRSLKYQTIKIEIIVVGPREVIDKLYSQKELPIHQIVVSNNKNLNEARNIGAWHASSESLLYIDDDALAEPFWAAKLVEKLEKEFDICGGRTFTSDTVNEEWSDSSITPYGRGLSAKEFVVPNFPGLLTRTVAGNNFGVRRTSLIELGGFDQIFRVFDDETDLCFRAGTAGMRVGYEPNAVVHHFSIESDLRNKNMAPTAMFRPWVSRAFFATRHGCVDPLSSLSSVIQAINQEVNLSFKNLDFLNIKGEINKESLERLKNEILNGAETGLSLALQYLNHTSKTLPVLSLFLDQSLSRGEKFFPEGAQEQVKFINPMHLVFVCRENSNSEMPGGIARWYKDLAKALSMRGILVTILTSAGDINTKITLVDGVWFHELGRDIPTIKSNYVDEYSYSPRLLPLPIDEFVKKVQTHLMWMSEFRPVTSVITPIFEGIGASIPDNYFRIVTMHTTTKKTLESSVGWFLDKEFEHYWAEPVMRSEELSLAKANLIISNSSASTEDAKQLLGKFVSRKNWPVIEEIPHGVNESSLGYVEFSNREKQITLVGRLEPRKGVDLAIKAFNILSRDFPDFQLVIIGSNNVNWLSKLQSLCESKQIKFLTDASDDLRDEILSKSLFSLTPSRYESYGLTVPEALRFGTPAIVNHVGGLRDFEMDEGVMSIDATKENFLREIVLKFGEPENWSPLSTSALQTFNSKYSQNSVSQQMLGLLERNVFI